MVNNYALIHHRAAMIHEQMAEAWRLLQGQMTHDEFFAAENPYYKLLDQLYAEEYPLARLLENSDLVFHAEGPDTKGYLPSIHAINWLVGGAEKQLRLLAKAIFDLTESSANHLAKNLDIRLTGFAPGSIYAGVKLQPGDGDVFFDGDQEPVFVTVRSAIRQLSIIPGFVDDEGLNAGIYEAMPDPAARDAGLTAAYRLSPTGRLGIHTVELFVPGQKPSELSQRERVVIHDALKKPKLHSKKHGTFTGEFREVDLDKTRFHLRNISGVGTLRCVFPEVTAEAVRPLLGSTVEVTGEYEMDGRGRPRFMLVSSFKRIETAKQEEMSL
ncbi:hypothetical protein F6R98_10335 [Candidatus Methylospira mobilis]|uniref:Uncharacterized protein n=1 Tax=Candidatus Methylospira mobilis TaxID=1808979 RepID=A0A5Q0BL87_9GAMM|nr:hypothetical protein [Candidatus Methylospira mobilis]QFY42961.1 hypothetical protein F6R98_10335 [Candidatus Methylospira mobilis]